MVKNNCIKNGMWTNIFVDDLINFSINYQNTKMYVKYVSLKLINYLIN